MGDSAFFHEVRKKHVQRDQLSGAGSASAPFVRQISQIFMDMASRHLAGSGNGQIIFSQSGEKLLNIGAVGSNGQRVFLQVAEKLVE